jgi:hypothetical protein
MEVTPQFRELPQYRCHKIVGAVKIDAVIFNNDRDLGGRIIGGGLSLSVPRSYIDKHAPAIGGYYVMYEDGYSSWSPAAAFEEGYTKLGSETETAARTADQARPRFEHVVLVDSMCILFDRVGKPWWADPARGTLESISFNDPHTIGWAVKQMRGGSSVRRKSWLDCESPLSTADVDYCIDVPDMLATDWEIVPAT